MWNTIMYCFWQCLEALLTAKSKMNLVKHLKRLLLGVSGMFLTTVQNHAVLTWENKFKSLIFDKNLINISSLIWAVNDRENWIAVGLRMSCQPWLGVSCYRWSVSWIQCFKNVCLCVYISWFFFFFDTIMQSFIKC